VFARGALAGQRHEIASEVSIGREGADLTLEDAEVSRRHAVIRPTGDSVEISDLGSANGTFVNGERIRDARLLEDGDVVRIGQTSLFVEVPLPPGRAMPTVMTPMLGRPALVVASGSLAGERFEIDSELSLGREGTDIVLDDREVSRRHGIVRPADGAAEIADLGSANGTFVNGERISAARRLVDGDIVRIGQTLLNFELSAPLSGSSATVIRRAPDAGQVSS
jgi:pSer/pThr/pTyr-binding forkhead associated (FHA) protein